MAKIRRSCWVVFQHQGKMLILKRGKQANNPGQWNFPGGNMDPGESAKQSAAREVFEETGIKLSVASLTKFKTVKYRNRLMMFYAVTPFSRPNAIINDESSKFRWVDWDEMPKNLHVSIRIFKKYVLPKL